MMNSRLLPPCVAVAERLVKVNLGKNDCVFIEEDDGFSKRRQVKCVLAANRGVRCRVGTPTTY